MEVFEKQDVEDLKSSVQFAKKFFSVHIPQLVGEQIGQFLIDKTFEFIELQPADISFYYFSNTDIFREFKREDDSEKARRWMKSHEEKLTKLFEQTSSLNEGLLENNLSPLTLERLDSKGGTPVQWRVRTGAIKSKSVPQGDVSNVRYIVTGVDDALPWARPFTNLVLTARKLMYATIVLLFVIAIPFYMLFGIVDWGSKELNTAIVIIGLLAALIFMSLYELLNKGITSYPTFWSKTFVGNKLLTINTTKNAESPICLKAVTIEATCSICGEDLLIEKSREFSNRFIGKCRVAPSEHVFSFDHITKRGKYLR